jgi:hypothetical protein
LKRVNKEVGRIRKLEARTALIESSGRALALKRRAKGPGFPPAGDTARQGMRSVPSERSDKTIQPAAVGSISQATKTAQAVRDAKS